MKFGRAVEEVVEQVHMPGTVNDQDAVVGRGRDALNIAEDPEVAVKPSPGFEIGAGEVMGLRFIFEKSDQVIAHAFADMLFIICLPQRCQDALRFKNRRRIKLQGAFGVAVVKSFEVCRRCTVFAEYNAVEPVGKDTPFIDTVKCFQSKLFGEPEPDLFFFMPAELISALQVFRQERVRLVLPGRWTFDDDDGRFEGCYFLYDRLDLPLILRLKYIDLIGLADLLRIQVWEVEMEGTERKNFRPARLGRYGDGRDQEEEEQPFHGGNTAGGGELLQGDIEVLNQDGQDKKWSKF